MSLSASSRKEDTVRLHQSIEWGVYLIDQKKAALGVHSLRHNTHSFVGRADATGIVEVAYRDNACPRAQRSENSLRLQSEAARGASIKATHGRACCSGSHD